MTQPTNGHSPEPDILDRIIELRNNGLSYNEAARVLDAEGYRNPSGNPYTSQGLAAKYRPPGRAAGLFIRAATRTRNWNFSYNC